LWRTPQAVAWEQLGWTRVVARYCHWSIQAEDSPEVPVALLGELRQLEDRLGLSPMAMLRLRWTIEQTPDDGSGSAPSSEGAKPASAVPAPQRRARVRVPAS